MSLTAEHILAARELIGTGGGLLRALDGLNLAVAITESLPLMTADRDLPKTAKRHKRSVIQIR